MEDFELTLYDRLEMIRSVLQYVPDDKVYIAFSGGKDSTVLSHLIDEAIPHNKIERVFTNTGIEFNAIKETGKTMVITGVRATEGSVRKWQSRNGCVFRQKDGSIYKFNPLSPVSEEFIDWYIKTRNIEICELYKPPYNFERTGCKGCPYNVHLAKELDTLDELLPNEKNNVNGFGNQYMTNTEELDIER